MLNAKDVASRQYRTLESQWEDKVAEIEQKIGEAATDPHTNSIRVEVSERSVVSGSLRILSDILSKAGYRVSLIPSICQRTRSYPLIVIWK